MRPANIEKQQRCDAIFKKRDIYVAVPNDQIDPMANQVLEKGK